MLTSCFAVSDGSFLLKRHYSRPLVQYPIKRSVQWSRVATAKAYQDKYLQISVVIENCDFLLQSVLSLSLSLFLSLSCFVTTIYFRIVNDWQWVRTREFHDSGIPGNTWDQEFGGISLSKHLYSFTSGARLLVNASHSGSSPLS